MEQPNSNEYRRVESRDEQVARAALEHGRRSRVACDTRVPDRPKFSSIQQIPKNLANTQCPTEDIHQLQVKQIYSDNGINAGHDYYHNQFNTFEENLKNAGILPGTVPRPMYGTLGGGPPVMAGAPETNPMASEYGIFDTYLYFDSNTRDATSNIGNGEIKFSVVDLNYNKPIDNIIEMEIGRFFIPDIVLPPQQPEFFFFKRVGMVIDEMTTMAIFANNNFRFHFEFIVQEAGISKELVPIQNTFTFSRPVRDFSQVTFKFTAPYKPIPFEECCFTVTSVASGGALQLVTNEPHNLIGFGFVAPPLANAITLGSAGAGVLTGTYQYVATFTTATGETNVNFNLAPNSFTYAANIASLTNIPIGPTGTTGRNIYRTFANTNNFFFLQNIPDNTTTAIVDNTADSGLGSALPVSNTTSLTATFAGYITGFNSNTANDVIINNVNGHMFTVLNATTIQMDPRAVIDPTLIAPGSMGMLGVGLRRIAFVMRFRSLSEKVTNRIMPI